MSIRKTIEAIKNAPDNLIYVEPEGRIQLNDLRELAEVFEALVQARLASNAIAIHRCVCGAGVDCYFPKDSVDHETQQLVITTFQEAHRNCSAKCEEQVNTDKVTHFEVMDMTGRILVRYGTTGQ